MTDFYYQVPFSKNISFELQCHIVERSEITDYLGQKVLDLAQAAYTRQLEVLSGKGNYRNPLTGTRLAKGTVAQEINPSSAAKVAAQTSRMLQSVDAGSIYAVAVSRNKQRRCESVIGLAKLTNRPRRNGEMPEHTDNGNYLQIDQVLATNFRRHIGSTVLYSALQAYHTEPGSRVIADNLAGSRANEWFQSLGFQTVGSDSYYPPIKFGDQKLPTTRLALPAWDSAETLMERMVQTWPWLGAAEIRD